MNCPACDHEKSTVLNTQRFSNFDFRKRKCCACGWEFQTTEAEVSYDVLLNAASQLTRERRKVVVGG